MKCQYPKPGATPAEMSDAELFADDWKCGRAVPCGRGPYCEEHAQLAFYIPGEAGEAGERIRAKVKDFAA